MKREEIINRDPDILGGTPVFTGTRVPAFSLIAHVMGGSSLDEFLDDFPSVRREQAIALIEMMLEVPLDDEPTDS